MAARITSRTTGVRQPRKPGTVPLDKTIQKTNITSIGGQAAIITIDIHGRGGTSFVPVIEYVNANRYFRDAILIYFTDGMGDRSIPRPLTLRTMWVLQDDQCELSVGTPYAETLVMDN